VRGNKEDQGSFPGGKLVLVSVMYWLRAFRRGGVSPDRAVQVNFGDLFQ